MTLRVWWAWDYEIKHLGCFPTKSQYAGHNRPIPVIRLDDLRGVVEGYLAEDAVNAWSDNQDFIAGYEQEINDLLAQLKEVGDDLPSR